MWYPDGEGIDMAYTTIELVQQTLGRSLTADEQAYFTGTLAAAIDAYIDKKTDTTFGGDTETDVYVSGCDTSMLIIPTMNSITQLKIDGNTIPSTEYVQFPQGSSETFSLRKKSGVWEKGIENYSVTGKLGYAEVPTDIKAVATELAANYFTGQQASISGAKSEKVGDWSITYLDSEKALSERSSYVLADYMRLSRRI